MARAIESSEAGEPQFTAELSPEVEEEVNHLLARLERGERKGILSQLTALAGQHPLHHVPQFALGAYQLMVNDDPAAALPFFQRAVEIYPYFTEAHYNLAGCAAKQGDIRKAVESLQKVTRYSDDADIIRRAREQLKNLESLVTAHEGFKTLDDYVASQEAFDDAFAALARKDFARAVDGFRKVLQGNPNHVQSYGNLGLAYAGLGRKAEALECLDKALALDPDYSPARSNRRTIEKMEEGRVEPLLMGETRYYLEKARAEEGSRGPTLPRRDQDQRSFWQTVKQFCRAPLQ